MKFQDLITQNGLTEQDLSHSIRREYQKLLKLEYAIQEAQQELDNPSTSEARKKTLAQQIAEGEDTFSSMEADLIKKFNKWFPNREKYAGMAERMKATVASGKQPSSPAEPDHGEPPAGAGAGAQPDPVVPDPPKDTPPAPPIVNDEPQRKPEGKEEGTKIGWGWIGIAAAALAVVIGVNVYNNR